MTQGPKGRHDSRRAGILVATWGLLLCVGCASSLANLAISASGVPTYAATVKAWPPLREDQGRVVVHFDGSAADMVGLEMNGLKASLVGSCFVFTDWAPGDYTLKASKAGLGSSAREVRVSVVAGRTTYVELSTDPIVGAVAEPKVLDKASEALAGSHHNWKDTEPWSRHDEKGRLKP